MTRFPTTLKTSNVAPGGARTSRVRMRCDASANECSAQKAINPGTPGTPHAGGRGSVRRSVEDGFRTSFQIGATVVRRGAGQSARAIFLTQSREIAGGRVPGGFRFQTAIQRG